MASPGMKGEKPRLSYRGHPDASQFELSVSGKKGHIIVPAMKSMGLDEEEAKRLGRDIAVKKE